ncbi:hypothetical protein Leryth_022103 [Lithospermum erythrorhizon]|nr:hypothetical protein Leryth_022103 [Lithospermum erythrorhizon]
MAGNDSQRHLFSLIRDFATEKSQGEHRVTNLKTKIGELQSELDSATADLEEAKNLKEAIEQEVKGYEVEFAVNGASLQALQARLVSIQDELSAIGSDVETLKDEEGIVRDQFLQEMFDLNAVIRNFQNSISSLDANENGGTTSIDGQQFTDMDDISKTTRDLEIQLTEVISQTSKEEQSYQMEQDVHKQVVQELSQLQRKASFIEAIMRESTELQQLSKYPYQSSHTC